MESSNPVIPVIPAAPAPIRQDIVRTEQKLRCVGIHQGSTCGKFLTKVVVIVSIPREMRAQSSLISELIPGIEVKVGHETKCTRCKQLNHTLDVL